jgi:N6-adenosine-specific RNA methylase IME4
MANPQANPMPALAPDEREALKSSIAREGMTYPVLVSAGPALQGEIVDGFNRRSIWLELGKKEADLPRVSKRFNTEAEFRIAQIDLNLKRRQLTVPQRILLAMAREPWERKLAKTRMADGAVAKSPQGDKSTPQRATALAAQAVGLKRDTYEHGKFVLEQAPKEIREQFIAGGLSVDRAFKDTRRALGLDARTVVHTSVTKRFGKMPTGSYGAIVVSPPWRLQSRTFEPGRVLPAELGALNIRGMAGKDAIVALVAPARWLREALELVTASWSGSIVTVLAHLRKSAIAGIPVAERAEFVIVAALGKPVLPKLNRDNVLETEAQLFGLMDELVPNRAGILLFGNVSRTGWDSWSPAIK